MIQRDYTTGFPAHLYDPQTGRIMFCAEAVALMIEQLERSDETEVRKALHGFESLFGTLFRNLNYSGVSFATQDLRDMDFSGAAFRGCAFDHAMVEEAVFRGALVDRAALCKAGDWPKAAARSCRSATDHQGTKRRPPPLLAPLFESWAPFSEAHHLPEFVMLPPSLEVAGLSPELRTALRSGRVAIGRYPVLQIEIDCMSSSGTLELRWQRALGRYATDDDRARLEPCRATLAQLEDYRQFLDAQFHSDHRLVPFTLLDAAHTAARRAGFRLFPDGQARREFATNSDGSLEIRSRNGIRQGYNPAVVQTEACFRYIRVFQE